MVDKAIAPSPTIKMTGRYWLSFENPVLICRLQDTMTEQSLTETPNPEITQAAADAPETPAEPKPSYVKLAMRNMVRKGGKSLFHFTLTVIALLGVLVGLSYLTR